jgi:hypothetical protein
MTLIYMLIGGCACFVWFNINSLIIDNMNSKACVSDKKSLTVDAIQSLYTWLTVVLTICFIGIVRGFRGIIDHFDIYDVKDLIHVIFMACTIGTIFIGALYIRNNPIIKAMTQSGGYPLSEPAELSNSTANSTANSTSSTVPANTTVSTMLNIMTIISVIATLFIIYKGKKIVEGEKRFSTNDIGDSDIGIDK